MNFQLSKPQQLLRETARATLSKACPVKRVRELMAAETPVDDALWQALIDQGWIGLHLSEDSGGLGLGLVELAIVAEETARAALPLPFLPTTWAATALAAMKDEKITRDYLGPIIEGRSKATVALLESENSWRLDDVRLRLEKNSEGWHISGTKSFVLDAGAADIIFCVARQGADLAVAAIPRNAKGLTLGARQGLDATRKLYDIELKNVSVNASQVVAGGAKTRAALEQAGQVATLVVCAEMVGAMQWVLETSVEYAKTRQQFGQPIGSFQSVQHQCADMLLYTESARAATYFAAWALTAGAPDAAKALSVAKAYCSDMGHKVCNHGVQVHGGIGFTWEHDLHLYYKRVTLCEFLFGDASYHREEIAKLILD